jgi:hypothetical protein
VQLLAPVALVCVLLAIAGGASRARWLPVAAFLAVAALASSYFWLCGGLQRRRTQRRRQTEVAFGVRYTQPLWMKLILPSMPVAIGAMLGALVAAAGFASVAAGILLIFAGLAVFISIAPFGVVPRGLTFETSGMRVHVYGGSFVVPWTAIARVDGVGPDHTQIVQLHLTDADAIIASHEPADPRVRARVERFLSKRRGGGGEMMMMPWAAGLDGPTIVRTIYAAQHGNGDRAN